MPVNCRSNAFWNNVGHIVPIDGKFQHERQTLNSQATDERIRNDGRSDGQRQTTCSPRSERSPERAGTGTWCCLAVGIGSPNASFAPFLQALIHGPTKFRVLLLHLQQSLLVVEPLCPARSAVELQAHL